MSDTNKELKERLRAAGQKTVQELSAEKFGARVAAVYKRDILYWYEERQSRRADMFIGRKVKNPKIKVKKVKR